MECNKDEAARSKSIAESKLEQKDFLGAKKFALKAQTLYPGLCGINQMLTTLDVFLSAEIKVNGETDCYGVLGVDPSADDDTIKKHYRQLALMLHPDKNDSVGADGGFKLISEARRMLLDKEKRAAYDERMGYKIFEQKLPIHTGAPSAPCRPHPHEVPVYNGSGLVPPWSNQWKVPSTPRRRSKKKAPSAPPQASKRKARGHANGPSVPPQPSPSGSSAPSMENHCFSFASRKTSIPKSQNRNAKVRRTPKPAPPHRAPETFWTVCRGCNYHYEYLKIFCSHILLCNKCVKPFMAFEVAAPGSSPKTAKSVPWLRRKRSSKNLPSQNTCDPKEKPGNVVQQAHDSLKRSRTDSHTSAGLGCFKKRKQENATSRHGINQGTSDFATEGENGMWSYGFSGTSSQSCSTEVLKPLGTRKLLILKAQKEILKNLSGFRL